LLLFISLLTQSENFWIHPNYSLFDDYPASAHLRNDGIHIIMRWRHL